MQNINNTTMLRVFMIHRLIILLMCGFFFSCTSDYIESPKSSGLIELSVQILGETERSPESKHGSTMAGNSNELDIRSLHIFVFDVTTATVEVREVIDISADGSIATDVFTGLPHPMWSGAATRNLRVTLTPGEKNICVVANWPTGATASAEFPVLRDAATMENIQSIIRSHNANIGLPTSPLIMHGADNVYLTGGESDIKIDVERQMGRVDLYPGISEALKNSATNIRVEGVKFRNIAGASFLTAHNQGGTPISPAQNTLWQENTFGGTPMVNNIETTTPSTAAETAKFGTFYIPEHIASDESQATEMVIKANYNGSIYYYGVKLHNGLTDASKRYWVERNHWYRYNITITGRGSVDETQPNYTNVLVGIRDKDWQGGESSTPDVGFELPTGSIDVVHFKGISRFILGTNREYSVTSDVNWISASRIVEGSGANARTYLEVMTGTNYNEENRTGKVTVLLANGLNQTLTINQLSEGNSVWKNPFDNTVWYKANLGAARFEDPGFFYQWNKNVAYSPYTPVVGIVPSAIDPLIGYGGVAWENLQHFIFAPNPVAMWNTESSFAAEWQKENSPCPRGYMVPTLGQARNLFNGITHASAAKGLNGYSGHWLNGTTSSTVGDGLFLLAYNEGRSNISGVMIPQLGGSHWVSDTKAVMATTDMSRWNAELAMPDTWGMSVRCVQIPTGTITASASSFFVSESVGNTSRTISINSTGPWVMLDTPTNVTPSVTSGAAGTTNVTFNRKTFGSIDHGDYSMYGDYTMKLKNTLTSEIIEIKASNLFLLSYGVDIPNVAGTNTVTNEDVICMGLSAKYRVIAKPSWVTSATVNENGSITVVAEGEPDGEARNGIITLQHQDDPAYTIDVTIAQDFFVNIPPFHYFVIKYTWINNDVDIRVKFTGNDNAPFDNQPIGWSFQPAVYDNPINRNVLLQWGGDATGGQGETAFFNAPLIDNNNALPRFIKLECSAIWYTQNRSGSPVRTTIYAYLGGVMNQVGTNFNNTGGELLYTASKQQEVSSNLPGAPRTYIDLVEVVYDRIKHSAQIHWKSTELNTPLIDTPTRSTRSITYSDSENEKAKQAKEKELQLLRK